MSGTFNVTVEADLLSNADFPLGSTTMFADSGTGLPVQLLPRYEIAFIMGDLHDMETLRASLLYDCEIHLLDPLGDGLAEIAGVLAGRTGIDALHIFSHGRAAQLQLGTTTLTNSSLNDYAATFSQIGSSLSSTGDILFYGCNVGQGFDGQALVDSIARLTAADVAASSDLTGSSAEGGDWVLEVQSGSIETNAIEAPMYAGVLFNHAPAVTLPSQLSFAGKVEYATGNGPMVITNADVNADGYADLITVSSNDNKVSVLLNNGNGTFASKVDYAVGNFPWSLTSADVNGDSKADLIAANWESSSVSVLINNGNGTFASTVDYGAGVNPIDVTSAYVNADGYIDLIVANHYSSTISVFINNGNGTFLSKADYVTGSTPNTITSADVNGDSKADIITANSSTVSVFINNGNGIFASKVNYVMADPYAVTTADVNGDGSPDMIVTNQVSNLVSVLINNGSGTFAAKADYAVGRCPQSVISADVNGDGKVDLIAANYYDTTVSVLTNNGDGTFASQVVYIVGNTPQSVTSADVNGDGKSDLIVANLSLATVSVLLNSSVTPPTAFTEQTQVVVNSGIVINDIDGNADWNGGKLKVQITSNAEFVDMLTLPISNSGGSGIWIDTTGNKVMAGSTEIGIANGAAVNGSTAWNFTFNASATNALVQDVARAVTFYNSSDVPGTSDRTVTFTVTDSSAASASVEQTLAVTAVNDAPTAANKTLTTLEDTALTVSAADFGFSDVEGNTLEKVMITTLSVNGTLNYNSIAVTLNQEITKADLDAGKLTFTPAENANGDAYASFGFKVSDGTVYSAAANTLTVDVNAVNDAPTISQPASILSFAGKVDYATGTQPFSVTSADVNGDGNADLVIANCTDPGTVSVLINKGDGTFNTMVDYAAGSYPYSVTGADVNRDGNADLIVTNTYSSPHTVSVLIGKGDGTFYSKVDYATGFQPKSVISADVNDDGNIDLITANYGTVSVLPGKDDGTFHTKVDYTTGYDSYCVTSADVNGDGKADLIVANQFSNSNNISVLLNKGDGTFFPKVDYETGSYSYSVISADVNGDSNADLIVANFTSNTVSVLLNKGDGTFYSKVDYATGNHPYSITSADVNEDGKVDLVAANYSDSTVSVLLGKGDGTFEINVEYTTGSVPHSVISEDVNRDGKADLIVVDNSPNKVSVLLNNSSVPSSTAFTEQIPVALSSAIVISDIDGNADWSGGTLKVQIAANNEIADTLSLVTVNPGGSGIWIDTIGNNVMSGSTVIGSADVASVSNGTAWTLTFNASATNALVQNVARALIFNNSSDTPRTSDRGVTFIVTDKAGLSASVEQTITVTAVNDLPTGGVTISGTATQYETLTAHNTLADIDGLGEIHYQWQAGGVNINGSTGETFALTESEVGKAISVVASYIDGQNTTESLGSSLTDAVIPATLQLKAHAGVTGLDVEVWLKANTLVDVADLVMNYDTAKAQYTAESSNAALAEWFWVPGSATADTLSFSGYSYSQFSSSSDVLLNTLNFTLDTGITEFSAALVNGTSLSNSTAAGNLPLGALPSLSFTHAPTVANPVADASTAEDAAYLFVVPATTFTDGDSGDSLACSATLADGTPLPEWLSFDAVTRTFSGTPLNEDVGIVTVQVTATDLIGLSASESFVLMVTNTNDAPTGGVTISGTEIQGEMLTAHNTLADVDGLGTMHYQWQAAGVDISGATGESLMLTASEIGKRVTVAASYTDGHGTLESVSSAATEVIAKDQSVINGAVTFWKTGESIGGVNSSIALVPDATGINLIEFRNMQVSADGTGSVEIWETSTRTDVNNLLLNISLSSESVATWQNATGLPSGWISVANTETAGKFILGSMGINALSAGPVKLGMLTMTAPVNALHFDLTLTSGKLGYDIVTAADIVSDTTMTDADGLWQHSGLSDDNYVLTTTKAAGEAEASAITANDALAALKIAVGMNPNTDGTSVSPYQYLAADINKDGMVKSADALNILKMAVHLSSAPANEWIFVSESLGSESMSRSHVIWQDKLLLMTIDHDQQLELIGIVKGDVDGSWVA